MSELLNGIFECLDINSGTGLATEDNLQEHDFLSKTILYTSS